MAEFTFRNIVQRALTYAEVDDNFRHVQELYHETLAARDVAVSDTIIYDTVLAGEGATADGDWLVVPDTGTDELVYYLMVAGSAEEKIRIGARLPFAGGTLTEALNHAPAVSLASAATVNIGAAAANAITITGTTTIAAFDTIADGAIRVLTFADALTLTHNATSLILPGGADITTAAGDVAVMLSLGGGDWRCIAYQRASGTVLNIPHTWAVAGEVKVPAGDADVIPGFFVPTLAPGQTVKLVEARHVIGSGTSATVKLQRNGVDITGFTGMVVGTTATLTNPADVTLAAGDYIQAIVTGVSGAPKNLTLTVALEYGRA